MTTRRSLQRSGESGGVEMPWFPDFANAVELARKQTRAAGQADPVAQYFNALNSGDTQPLESEANEQVAINSRGDSRGDGHRQNKGL